jgi:cellulose synthase/poly-beta-1,6-N-acetylglucosamine synthase-like glycosyltransferase
MTTVAAILFWLSAGAILYTHLGYPLVLWLLVLLRGQTEPGPAAGMPAVSLIVPAYDEEEVIAAKVANALALEYPRRRLRRLARRHRRARPRRRRRSRPRAAGWRQGRRPQRRG